MELFFEQSQSNWLANANSVQPVPVPVQAIPALAISELNIRYLVRAMGCYSKNGKPTSEVNTIKRSMVYLSRLYPIMT